MKSILRIFFWKKKIIMKVKSELFLKLNIKLKKKGLKKLEQKKGMHKKPKKRVISKILVL